MNEEQPLLSQLDRYDIALGCGLFAIVACVLSCFGGFGLILCAIAYRVWGM